AKHAGEAAGKGDVAIVRERGAGGREGSDDQIASTANQTRRGVGNRLAEFGGASQQVDFSVVGNDSRSGTGDHHAFAILGANFTRRAVGTAAATRGNHNGALTADQAVVGRNGCVGEVCNRVHAIENQVAIVGECAGVIASAAFHEQKRTSIDGGSAAEREALR